MKIISRKEAVAKNLEFYFTGKPCKHGHISKRSTKLRDCSECRKSWNKRPLTEDKKERKRKLSKEYREKNKEKVAESKRIYEKNNKERINESAAKWRGKNKDAIIKKRREWYIKNKEARREYARKWAAQNKDRILEYARTQRRRPKVKAIEFMRKCVHRSLCQGDKRTSDILGYTREDLVKHIEAQFSKGMTWENYGEWHIDHIVPISALIEQGVKEPSKINCLSNLRPLWAKENLEKGKVVEVML